MRRGSVVVKLAEVAEINPRLTNRLAADAEVSFVPMSAVSSETVCVESPEVRRYEQVRKGYTPFLRGDVLVAKITPCFENGKIARADIPHPVGFGSTEFHVVRPLDGRLDGRYLLHLLRQDRVRCAGKRRMTGSGGQRRVPAVFLEELEVLLPSLCEQHRIAEVLDRVELLRAKRRQALVKLQCLGEAIFLDLCGDPITNPKQWSRRRIRELGDVVTGNTPSRANGIYFGNAIEWIKSDNLGGSHYYATPAAEGLSEAGKAVARTVPPSSILVTCIAGSPNSIGNSAMTNREVTFNQQINALVPREGDPHFLFAQLRVGKRLVQEASTGGMKGLVSKSRFGEIELIFPPVSLQHEFARQIAAVERLKVAQRTALADLDALFASLQYRAFRGEL